MQPRQIPPEHPYPEYTPPSGPVRFLGHVRDHGFALTLAAILLGGVYAFRTFVHLEGGDPGELAIPIREGTTAASAANPYDSLAVLTVQTYPHGAAVYLEGTSLGLAPIERVRVAPGTYRVSFDLPAHAPLDSTVTLAAGQTTRLVVPLFRAQEGAREAVFEVAEATPAQRGDPERARRTRPARASAAETATPPARPPTVPEKVSVAEVQNPAAGRLELRSEPAGAAVWLDRRFVGYTPLSLNNVEPGEHALTFRKLGYESPTTLVGVRPGHTLTVSPRLNTLTGTLRVLAKPWGSIYINGELKQEATNVRYSTQLPPGQYRITVVHPVLGRWETFAKIEAGKDASFVVDFNSRDKTPSADSLPNSG